MQLRLQLTMIIANDRKMEAPKPIYELIANEDLYENGGIRSLYIIVYVKEYAHENKYGTSNQIEQNRVKSLIVRGKTEVERLQQIASRAFPLRDAGFGCASARGQSP